jgi:hypothetical protein
MSHAVQMAYALSGFPGGRHRQNAGKWLGDIIFGLFEMNA